MTGVILSLSLPLFFVCFFATGGCERYGAHRRLVSGEVMAEKSCTTSCLDFLVKKGRCGILTGPANVRY
ncbi:hypothetical protein L209DRAFT_756213, partial [Thermothelomyces heterothallicus CBS 203.75]